MSLMKTIKKSFRRKKKVKKEKGSLKENIQETDGEQMYEDCPLLTASDDEVRTPSVLSDLRNFLSEHSNTEDTAAERVEKWSKLISTMESVTEDGGLQIIDEFVESHFPELPVEGAQGSELKQLQEFLKSTQSMIFNEVLQIKPVLEEVRLLDPLINSYIRHIFNKLDLLLNRDLSAKETFCLLMWGKDVFFGQDLQHAFRVSDPLLLTGWFERTTEKLLTKLQNEISSSLQNILDYDENGHNADSLDEETVIRVNIDVTQCLNAAVQSSKKISQTLMRKVQNLCLQELHQFVQKYVDAKKKQLEESQTLNKCSQFGEIRTCRQLRFSVRQLVNADMNKSDLSNITSMLKEMEDHVLSIMQNMLKHLAKDSLSRYFKRGDEHIHFLTEEIQTHCASLPQTDVGKEIQEIFVNVAFDCVSHVYLECLMKSKFKRLEKRWGNVGEKMKDDSLFFNDTFKQLNGGDDQKFQLLQRMSEVLCCSDVEALKLICCNLYKDFPKDSEEYVSGLLYWRKDLSERQVREVLCVVQDLDLDTKPKHVTCFPLKDLLHLK